MLLRPDGEPEFEHFPGRVLRNQLERAMGEVVPATLIWNHPTISALSAELARRAGIPLEEEPLDAPEPTGSDRAGPPSLDAALAELEQLSDEEARQLLAGDEGLGGQR